MEWIFGLVFLAIIAELWWKAARYFARSIQKLDEYEKETKRIQSDDEDEEEKGE